MIHGLPGYGSQGQIGIDGSKGSAIMFIDDIINFTDTNSISYGDVVLDKNNTQWMYFGDLGFKEISKFNISSAFAYNDKKNRIYSNNEFVFHNTLTNTSEFTDIIRQDKSIINIIGERDSSTLLSFNVSTSSLAFDSSKTNFHVCGSNNKSICIDNLYVSNSNILSHEYGYYIIDEIRCALTYNKNDKRFSAPLFDNFEYMLFYSPIDDNGNPIKFSCIKSFKDFAIVSDVDYDNLHDYFYKIIIKSTINDTGYLVDSFFTLFPEYYNISDVKVYDESNKPIENGAVIKNNNIEIISSNYNYIDVYFDKDVDSKYIKMDPNIDKEFLDDNHRVLRIRETNNFFINVTGTTYNFTIRRNTGTSFKNSFRIIESKNNRLYYSTDFYKAATNEVVEVYDVVSVGDNVTSGEITVKCTDALDNKMSEVEIKMYNSDIDFNGIRDINGNIITNNCTTVKKTTATFSLNANTLKKYNKLIIYRKINSTTNIAIKEPTVTTVIDYKDVTMGEDKFSASDRYVTGVIRWKINAMTADKIKNAIDYDLRVYNKLSRIDTGKFEIPSKYGHIEIKPRLLVDNLTGVYSPQSFLKIGYNRKSTESVLNTDNVNYTVYVNGNENVPYNGPLAGYMNMDYPLWTNVSFDISSLNDGSIFYSRSTARGGNLSPLSDGIIISSKFNINLKNNFTNSDLLCYACLGKQTTTLDNVHNKYITKSINFKNDDFASYYDITPRSFEIDNATKTYNRVVNVLTNMYIGDSLFNSTEFYIDASAKEWLDASQYTISKQLVSGEINTDIKIDITIDYPPVIGNPEVPTPDINIGSGNIIPGGGFIPSNGNNDEEIKVEDSFTQSNYEGEINIR